MTAATLFRTKFRSTELFDLYDQKIRPVATSGTDGCTREAFDHRLSSEIVHIEQRTRAGQYRFAPFKGRMIPRTPTKTPRLIVKPTIRDRITLRVLYEILSEVYKPLLVRRSLHTQIAVAIRTVKSRAYNHVLRFDVADFYPSIDHAKLIRLLKRRIRKPEILKLIADAIATPCDIDKSAGVTSTSVGVPQGLSISNVLANVFLSDIDDLMEKRGDLIYLRYVDDVLIFCDSSVANVVEIDLVREFERVGLRLPLEDKYESHAISEEFDYLGYVFTHEIVSVRDRSRHKLESSIIRMLTAYRRARSPNAPLLRFKLNLRITGCVLDGRKFGWLFYFSQLTDEEILHRLDSFVSKILKQNSISLVGIKRFVRAWKEMTLNFTDTHYIPKYDAWSPTEKRNALSRLFGPVGSRVSDDEVSRRFSHLVYSEVRDMERDLSGLS